MRIAILLISALFTQLTFANTCQFVNKLKSTVSSKYKPLIGKFDSRGRYFQPSTKLFAAPSPAKCRIRTLPLPGGYYVYSCRWEFPSKEKLEVEFKAMVAKLKTCRIDSKAINLAATPKNHQPPGSAQIKWSNYSKYKAIIGSGTVLSISKQTVTFTSKNQTFHLLQFSFGSAVK